MRVLPALTTPQSRDCVAGRKHGPGIFALSERRMDLMDGGVSHEMRFIFGEKKKR